VAFLDLEITEQETERLKKLIYAVGRRIRKMKFDPEPKKEKVDDIIAFEERIIKEEGLI
jgi:hypothetical protein